MNTDELSRKQGLLESHRMRLHEREIQVAQQGINADPVIRTEIEGIKREIRDLEKEIENLTAIPAPEIEIPFVIMAMTRNEATSLITEDVFDDHTVAPVERIRYQHLNQALQEHGIKDLPLSYGEQRENWKPHNCQDKEICIIISEITDHVNRSYNEMPGLPQIKIKFVSANFFAEDMDTRVRIWDTMSRSGCIVIVDAVSLFHPVLRQMLLQSEMGANERVAILVLSPVGFSSFPINQLIEQEINLHMNRAFMRFSRIFDKLCEFSIGDLRSLQRWLFTIIPETTSIIQNERANPHNRRIFRNQMGEPRGMEGIIFGQRVKQ